MFGTPHMRRRDQLGLALVTATLLVLVVREVVRTPSPRAAATAMSTATSASSAEPAVQAGSATLVRPPPTATRPTSLDALRLRIDAARAMAAARAALPPDIKPLTGQEISDAVGDAMQRSRACWPSKQGAPNRVARLVLLSDAELGLFVDTTEITDADGKSLPREVDDCMRDAIDGMEIKGTYFGGRVTETWFFDE